MSVAYGVSIDWADSNITNSLSGLPNANLIYAIDANRKLCTLDWLTAADLAGSTVTSTYTNGVYVEPAIPSNGNISSFVFGGTNNYIALSKLTNTYDPLILSYPWTCHFWVKTSSDGALLSHYSGGPVLNGMYISGGKLMYAYYDTTWHYITSPGVTVTSGRWTLITYTCPSSTGNMKMYVNGLLDHSFAPAATWRTVYSMASIGCLWGPSTYFNGRMSMILVYNIEHSSTDVTSMYNITRKRFGV